MHVGVKQVLLRSKGKQKGEGLPPSAPEPVRNFVCKA